MMTMDRIFISDALGGQRRLFDEGFPSNVQDGDVLRNTFMVYGPLLLITCLFFCWIRKRFPRPFTVRSWTSKPRLKTHLADQQYGFFSWMWTLSYITDEEIMNECGMDALCFLRTLSMGYKLSLLGVFNSFWLIPLYKLADPESTLSPAVQITVSNLPPGSERFLGSVLACYMLFLFTMYLVLKEFEWFIEMRVKFLRKRTARNYTVYVSNVPLEYRTNTKLKQFFEQCFTSNCVLEARLRVKASNLGRLVNKRDLCIFNLETALAMEEIRGEPPKHKCGLLGTRVNSIEAYSNELRQLNEEISRRIDRIEEQWADDIDTSRCTMDKTRNTGNETKAIHSNNPVVGNIINTAPERNALGTIGESFKLMAMGTAKLATSTVTVITGGDPQEQLGDHLKSIATGANKLVGSAAVGGLKIAATAVQLVSGGDDGEYYSGGFVTFNSVSVANTAQQMVHNAIPFEMEVDPAPDPKDVFWFNVGRSAQDLQLGKLFSFSATVTICFLWTIPMTVLATFSSVQRLREQFKIVEDAIRVFPLLEPILEQLAPFLLIALNALLPYILEALSMFEGPVSGSVVVASAFTKEAIFMIVQTFFVSAISGGLLEEIKAIINEPLSAIDLLANTLPAQSTFFIQVVFVGTVVTIAWENLRPVPLSTAFLRKWIGPQTTKKQRQRRAMKWIRPLADPFDFEHASYMAQITVLNFMILMVYQVISPLTSFVLGFCFLLMRPFFLHQFVYIYPVTPDSGGVIWSSFVKILLACILVSELTIVGFLTLKKASIAVSLMIPLIVITMLFNAYIREEHFRVASVLPSTDCMNTDVLNKSLDFNFLKGCYTQEELKFKKKYIRDTPSSIDVVKARASGILPPSGDNRIASPSY